MARGMRIGVIILTFKHVPGFSPVLAIKNNGWSNKSSSKHETKSRFQRYPGPQQLRLIRSFLLLSYC